MKKKLKEVAPIYKAIRATPGLRWLDKNYHSLDGCTRLMPLSNYQEMVQATRIYTCVQVLVSLSLITLLFTSSHESLDTWRNGWKLGVNIVAAIGLIVLIVHFNLYWNKLVNEWIKSRWTTANFADDVARLVNLFVNRPFKDTGDLVCLAGTGPETAAQLVPRHLTELFSSELRDYIGKIIRMPEGSGDHDKDVVKKYFGWYQQFLILGNRASLQNMYHLATNPANSGRGKVVKA